MYDGGIHYVTVYIDGILMGFKPLPFDDKRSGVSKLGHLSPQVIFCTMCLLILRPGSHSVILVITYLLSTRMIISGMMESRFQCILRIYRFMGDS